MFPRPTRPRRAFYVLDMSSTPLEAHGWSVERISIDALSHSHKEVYSMRTLSLKGHTRVKCEHTDKHTNRKGARGPPHTFRLSSVPETSQI